MAIRRVHSSPPNRATLYAVTFDDGVTVELEKSKLSELNTAAKLNQDLTARLAGRSEKIFLHLNRRGNVAVATGSEPETWPEDEQEAG